MDPTPTRDGQAKQHNETINRIHDVEASATTEVITKAMCETP